MRQTIINMEAYTDSEVSVVPGTVFVGIERTVGSEVFSSQLQMDAEPYRRVECGYLDEAVERMVYEMQNALRNHWRGQWESEDKRCQDG